MSDVPGACAGGGEHLKNSDVAGRALEEVVARARALCTVLLVWCWCCGAATDCKRWALLHRSKTGYPILILMLLPASGSRFHWKL